MRNYLWPQRLTVEVEEELCFSSADNDLALSAPTARVSAPAKNFRREYIESLGAITVIDYSN